jgi:hypothetical protein
MNNAELPICAGLMDFVQPVAVGNNCGDNADQMGGMDSTVTAASLMNRLMFHIWTWISVAVVCLIGTLSSIALS